MFVNIFGILDASHHLKYYDAMGNSISLCPNTQYTLQLMVPSEWVTTYVLDVPKMSNEKLLKAAAFNLEDKLIDDISSYHLVIINKEVDNKIVGTIAHEKLTSILSDIPQNCHLVKLMTASLLLSKNEALIENEQVALNVDGQCFSVSKKDLPFYREKFDIVVLANESHLNMLFNKLNQSNINLLTGKYKPKKTKKNKTKKIYYLLLIVISSILLYFLISLIEIISLKHQSASLEKQIEQIYYQLFPSAKSVIAPEIRVNQLLKSNSDNNKKSNFLNIIFKLTEVIKQTTKIQLNSLRYNNKSLLVTINAPAFVDIDNFKKQLISHGLKVKQQSGKIDGKQVKAALSLEVA